MSFNSTWTSLKANAVLSARLAAREACTPAARAAFALWCAERLLTSQAQHGPRLPPAIEKITVRGVEVAWQSLLRTEDRSLLKSFQEQMEAQLPDDEPEGPLPSLADVLSIAVYAVATAREGRPEDAAAAGAAMADAVDAADEAANSEDRLGLYEAELARQEKLNQELPAILSDAKTGVDALRQRAQEDQVGASLPRAAR